MSDYCGELITEIISRRRFLQQAGLISGGLGVSIFGSLAWPRSALAVCDPPGSPGPRKNGAWIVGRSRPVGRHQR